MMKLRKKDDRYFPKIVDSGFIDFHNYKNENVFLLHNAPLSTRSPDFSKKATYWRAKNQGLVTSHKANDKHLQNYA